MIAAVAGIALTGTIQSADITHLAVSTCCRARGGGARGHLAGRGRGGFLGSALGATCVFLLQNLLSALQHRRVLIQVAYGGVLFVAVVAGSRARSSTRVRHGGGLAA